MNRWKRRIQQLVDPFQNGRQRRYFQVWCVVQWPQSWEEEGEIVCVFHFLEIFQDRHNKGGVEVNEHKHWVVCQVDEFEGRVPCRGEVSHPHSKADPNRTQREVEAEYRRGFKEMLHVLPPLTQAKIPMVMLRLVVEMVLWDRCGQKEHKVDKNIARQALLERDSVDGAKGGDHRCCGCCGGECWGWCCWWCWGWGETAWMRRCEGWGHLLKGSLLCPHQFGVIQPQITRRTRWGKERLSEKSGINQVFEVAQLFTNWCTQCAIVNSFMFNLGLAERFLRIENWEILALLWHWKGPTQKWHDHQSAGHMEIRLVHQLSQLSSGLPKEFFWGCFILKIICPWERRLLKS